MLEGGKQGQRMRGKREGIGTAVRASGVLLVLVNVLSSSVSACP